MANKNDRFYFSGFVHGITCSCEAAQMLKATLNNFDADRIHASMEELHAIENRGDRIKHEMLEALVKAFITPIEREDIFKLSEKIDDLTDAIEDILIHIYTNNISSIRPDIVEYTSLLTQCCDATKNLLMDLESFPKSKQLRKYVVEINHLEEVADKLYIGALRDLHTAYTNTLDVVVWREIYKYFERCFDACEHIADVVETIMITNT